MLSASAITIEGIKITHLPFSHFSKISDAFMPSFGLSVNHHIRAWVSVTKFMGLLYLYLAAEGLLCKSDVFISNIHTLQNSFEGSYFFACSGDFFEDGNF